MNATFPEPKQIWLELSTTTLEQAWEQSQSWTTPYRRWQTYVNLICLGAILPWLREEFDAKASAALSLADLRSCWEMVDGTAINLDGMRVVVIASEDIDLSELRIPQEWVDIPTWLGDYYLAVQINPDDGWLRIWGYCTHEQLKQNGTYEPTNRTYCLGESELINDLNALGVARKLCPDEVTQVAVDPLPILHLAQAENLLQRLGNTAVIAPRLAIPFALWGALLSHGGWRKRLYQLRLGNSEQWLVKQWLTQGITPFATHLGWQRLTWQTNLVGARGDETTPNQAMLSRQLIIAGQKYELRVLSQGEQVWRFELHNTSPGGRIPGGFKLRLLTEDLQPFANNEAVANRAIDLLYIEVKLAPGEGLVWETEPVSANYDREILRF